MPFHVPPTRVSCFLVGFIVFLSSFAVHPLLLHVSSPQEGAGRPAGIFNHPASSTTPTAPLNLVATAGYMHVNLTWSSPLDEGGEDGPIVGYRIYATARITSVNDYFFNETSESFQFCEYDVGVVYSFTDNCTLGRGIYNYSVAAINTKYLGPCSNNASATPFFPPFPPHDWQGISGDGQVALSWVPPVDDGGKPVTNYKIYRGLAIHVIEHYATVGAVSTYLDTNVTNGQQLVYAFSAVNDVGESEQAGPLWVTPGGAPTEPQDLIANAGDAHVTLGWQAPASNGGSAITHYSVYRGTSSGGETWLATLGNVLEYNDTGVINGQEYYYKVSASNSYGESVKSNEVSATPKGAPGAPRNLAATAGDEHVLLSWQAPSSDGGSPVSGYNILVGIFSGAEMWWDAVANVLSYDVTGLDNGQAYFFKVSAMNAIGTGPPSEEASTTPAATPGAPQAPVATPGTNRVELSWSAPPTNGGSPVVGYKIYRNTSSGGSKAPSFMVFPVYSLRPCEWVCLASLGNVTSWTDTNVTGGITYLYRITAMNAAGESLQSIEVSATPSSSNELPPGIPGYHVALLLSVLALASFAVSLNLRKVLKGS